VGGNHGGLHMAGKRLQAVRFLGVILYNAEIARKKKSAIHGSEIEGKNRKKRRRLIQVE
jgi:hypothetical protein